MQKYKPKDTFCLLGITNTDIYPNEDWDFVFSYANIPDRVGVHSFARYEDQETKENNENHEHEWNKTSTHVLAHEICLTMGMKPCVYYECLMNSVTDGEEARQRKEFLCGVCLKKLAFNLQFDVEKRQKDLIKVCEELDFKHEANSHKIVITKADGIY